MPLVRTIQAGVGAKVAIWHIKEPEEFFDGRVRVERIVRHPLKRLQHLAARYLLEELEPSFPVRSIRISASGKPYLPDDAFYFSLSHSGDYAAAIVGQKGPVGIDVEKISAKIERVSGKFLRPDELAFISREDRIAHLTLCWCIKEAVVKWFGKGGVDFKADIRLAPFPFSVSGYMQACFLKDGAVTQLPVGYFRECDYQLAWIAGTNE